MFPVALKFRVIDAQKEVDYFLGTNIFEFERDMPGIGGARIVTLRSVDGVVPFHLEIEQPHESRLKNWEVSKNSEITLPCRNLKFLREIYQKLKEASIKTDQYKLSQYFDRPWGGQFFLTDLYNNQFMFVNAPDEK